MARTGRTLKKTNVADTSIKTYREIAAEGLLANERALILSLMLNKGAPVTSRELMKLAHKERGNITRTLYDLEKGKKVEISHKDKCPITGRTVRYYKLVQDKQSTQA